jgi:hypothetical protein
VPEGFNNNIIWNVAHIVVTQQLLVYKLSGLPMLLTDEMVEKYRKVVKPAFCQSRKVNKMSLLTETIDLTEKDIKRRCSQTLPSIHLTGYVLTSAQDMAFNNFHEGIHLGVILGHRKLV